VKPAPYSFHCTPCGHAHAGECPPKADRSPGATTKHFNHLQGDAFPHVGTTWWKMLLPVGGPQVWQRRSRWTVTGLDYTGNRVWARIDGGTQETAIMGECWTEPAGVVREYGARMRFEKA
jgi:hypothetical protein